MRGAKVSSPRSRRRPARSTAAFALAFVLAAVPAAHAQDPGVVYEPGSPSDKEYAIPLEEVRRDAGGERPGKLEALPFGIGLSRRGGGRPGARPATGQGRGSERGQGGRSAPARERGAQSGDFRERLADAEGAGAPFVWKLGPLLLVLLPALLAGLLLARRERQQPAT